MSAEKINISRLGRQPIDVWRLAGLNNRGRFQHAHAWLFVIALVCKLSAGHQHSMQRCRTCRVVAVIALRSCQAVAPWSGNLTVNKGTITRLP